MTKCQKNYKKALEKGVLKILSKMGISLLSCYHGAQIFEAYGLGKEVVDFAFKGSVSRIGGMSLADLQCEAESFWIKVGFSWQPESVFLLCNARAGLVAGHRMTVRSDASDEKQRSVCGVCHALKQLLEWCFAGHVDV